MSHKYNWQFGYTICSVIWIDPQCKIVNFLVKYGNARVVSRVGSLKCKGSKHSELNINAGAG